MTVTSLNARTGPKVLETIRASKTGAVLILVSPFSESAGTQWRVPASSGRTGTRAHREVTQLVQSDLVRNRDPVLWNIGIVWFSFIATM